MSAALGPSGALIAPTLVAVLLICLAVRLARAILRLVVVVLVVMLLVWGYMQYRQAVAWQSAAQHVATQVGRDLDRPLSSAPAVLAQVHKALLRAGLDPSMIEATITCVDGNAVLVLTDPRAHGALGLLDGAAVRVHLSPAIHCARGS
jgi:small-conductance mechanosensitive channel